MSNHQHRQDREELRELLQQYNNLRHGRGYNFIEEDGFDRIIDHFDDKEQFNLALEAADFALGQFPYSSSMMIRKADLLISLRRYQEALEFLNQAELYDSRDINLYILRTDAYLALDMQEKAVSLLEDALVNFDGDEKLDLLFELADVYDDYENFEKVFDCLKMILEIDPCNEEALYKICFWTDFTGRNEESIRLHQQIIEESPYCELAWFNLGAAYQGIKLYEKAVDAYQYAVAIDEKFDFAYRNMGDAFIRLRKYKEAIEVLEKVLELAMPETVIYEALGHCYEKMENFAQARFHYKKASHLDPEDSQMQFKIASTYMNEENWTQAIKVLELALKAHRMQPEYNLAMGRCFMATGNIEEAITYLGVVVRVRPKNSKAWMELLKCLYKGGMYDDGLQYASFAMEHLEKKPVFIFYQAAFQIALGKSRESLVTLERGMNINPKLIKYFLELNPSFLQHQQIVELIARYKKKKSR
jgi:tetratricopeptide (TPR) repeat protein